MTDKEIRDELCNLVDSGKLATDDNNIANILLAAFADEKFTEGRRIAAEKIIAKYAGR